MVAGTFSGVNKLEYYIQGDSASPTQLSTPDLPANGTATFIVEYGPGYGMFSDITATERTVSAKIIDGLATFVLPRAHNISVTVQKSTPALKSPVLELVDANSEEDNVVLQIPDATPRTYKASVAAGKYYARLSDSEDPFVGGVSGTSGYESTLQTITVPGATSLSVKAVPLPHGTLSLKFVQEDGSTANFRRHISVCAMASRYCHDFDLAAKKNKATIKLAPGYYTVSGHAGGYTAKFTNNTLQNDFYATVQIKKNKTTKETLRVRSWGAAASGKHTVSFKNDMPGWFVAYLENSKSSYVGSSSNGVLAFYNVKNGSYRLTVPGLATRPKVTIKNGKLASSKSIKTSGAKITGKLSGASKMKYPVDVVLTNSATQKRVATATITKGSTYTFYNVPKGKYTLTAYNGVSYGSSTSLDAGSLRTASGKATIKSSTKKTTVNLKFKKAGKVKVKLVGPNGKPLARTLVALRTSKAWLPVHYSTMTDSKGYVTFKNVPYGKVQVLATIGDTATPSSKTITVKKSSQSTTLKVTQ